MPLAILCTKHGNAQDLVVDTVEEIPLQSDQLRICVKSVGLNFFDTLIIQNKYQQKPDLPFSPGGEIAGIVIEVGKEVKDFKTGDRIAAYCGYGGCREQVILPAKQAIILPKDIDYSIAASMLITYGTAYLGLIHRAHLQPNEKLCVLGAAGGVGTATMDVAKAIGSYVIATASTQEKITYCHQRGANICLDYADNMFKHKLKEQAAESGIDVIFDNIGGPKSIDAMSSLKWGGRFLVVGFAAGEITQLKLNRVLLKNIDVLGVNFGLYVECFTQAYKQDMQTLYKWVVEKKIHPIITHTTSLENTPSFIERIACRNLTGKAVIELNRN